MLKLNKIRRDQAGFTLVEIAIVMVIIGLIIGGVLKGQAMIENAKVKRAVKQGDELRAAIMTFFDKYGVYPGDENLAAIPPGTDTEGNNNGQIAGAEAYGVFLDLSLADLISGTYNGTSDRPVHPFGGNLDVTWINNPPGASTSPGHYLRYFRMPAEVCLEVDTKYDDGVFNSGTILGSADYTAGTTIAIFYMKF
jgi:prepilin-type N-terminal cleavage/methylation domain-containing protein